MKKQKKLIIGLLIFSFVLLFSFSTLVYGKNDIGIESIPCELCGCA